MDDMQSILPDVQDSQLLKMDRQALHQGSQMFDVFQAMRKTKFSKKKTCIDVLIRFLVALLYNVSET